MNRLLWIFLIIYPGLLAQETKVNDNISGKLSLFPLIVGNSSNSGPEAWIIWTDNREQSYEVYCNGLKSNLSRYWNGDAVISKYPDASHNGHRLSPVACKGNSGDMYVAFVNHHDNAPYSPGIYVQRIKPDSSFWENTQGKPQPVKITTNSTNPPSIAPSGDGGCVIAWMEKSGEKYKIMAEKRNASGDSGELEDSLDTGK